MSDKRVSVDVKVGDEPLRLFSEQNGLVVLASVYNVTVRRVVAPSEPVEHISHGKQRAVAYAEAYLKPTSNLVLPLLKWIKCLNKSRKSER
jgi:hypothetical protein